MFDKEVDKMLKLNVIELSKSSYASPVVMVRKTRQIDLCIYFRLLIEAPEFDAEPMPLLDEHLHKFGGAKFIT